MPMLFCSLLSFAAKAWNNMGDRPGGRVGFPADPKYTSFGGNQVGADTKVHACYAQNGKANPICYSVQNIKHAVVLPNGVAAIPQHLSYHNSQYSMICHRCTIFLLNIASTKGKRESFSSQSHVSFQDR
jgi:hypothetical protein